MSSLNNINLKGGGDKSDFYPVSGFSYSGMMQDTSTSVFVKCQIIALWFIIILIVIMCVVGHKRAQQRPYYRNHNIFSRMSESAAEGFNTFFG